MTIARQENEEGLTPNFAHILHSKVSMCFQYKLVSLMKPFVLIVALLGFFQSFGQQNFPMGLVLDDEEYLQVPQSSDNIHVDLGQKAVPRTIDLSPLCPEVRDQGDISSCVGWSAGYAAMTIERALLNGWSDKRHITQNANSALFVYNQLANGDCKGVRMPKALELLAEKGNCLAREYDFDVNDCSVEVPNALIDKAKNHRIEEHIRLFDPKAESDNKVIQVKLVLSQRKPVIVGMKVLNNFYAIRHGDESWMPTVGDRTYAGGHAMVVVGYDDDKFGQGDPNISPEMSGAFKVMNSWGKNWGEDGFIWIRYSHFGDYCRHAYALMLEGGDEIDFDVDMTPVSMPTSIQGQDLRSMAGSFGFKLYTGRWLEDKPLFKEQLVRLENKHYVLKNRKVGEQFQLFVKSDFDRGYIYVFSVDPHGKPEVHFPRAAPYNEKFSEHNESALLLSSGSMLTIPTYETALTIAHPGIDHLVVLFSEKKIKPKYIRYLSETLASDQGMIQDRLPRILQKHMIPFADITYSPGHMGFEVSTRSSGKIVPIILRVEAE